VLAISCVKQKRKFFDSYTFRLALLYAIIFSGSTLILFYFFYIFTASYMTQQMDTTIEAEIQGLAERYDNEGIEGLTKLIASRVSRQQATGNSIYLLTTYTLQPLVGNLDRWPKTRRSIMTGSIHPGVNEQTNEIHQPEHASFAYPGATTISGRDVTN